MALVRAELADVRACDKEGQAKAQENVPYKAQSETQLSVNRLEIDLPGIKLVHRFSLLEVSFAILHLTSFKGDTFKVYNASIFLLKFVRAVSK